MGPAVNGMEVPMIFDPNNDEAEEPDHPLSSADTDEGFPKDDKDLPRPGDAPSDGPSVVMSSAAALARGHHPALQSSPRSKRFSFVQRRLPMMSPGPQSSAVRARTATRASATNFPLFTRSSLIQLGPRITCGSSTYMKPVGTRRGWATVGG